MTDRAKKLTIEDLMTDKKIIVKQDAEKPMPIEILAQAIKAISDGIRKLRGGRLNERALILLIQHASPTVRVGPYGRTTITAKTVKTVLEGIGNLESEYLKPVKK